ncbi:MAG TPA: hypothetical protein VMG12_43540 [Polyangiaceae bacterium]|nr:hypothetical protein [Polyangiaceae bacterium]
MKAPFRKVTPSPAPSVELGDEPPSSRRPRSLPPPSRLAQAPALSARALPRPPASAQQSIVVARNEGELFLDFPKPLEVVTAMRSTQLTSSLTALRAFGLFERYDALQTSPHRQKILNVVAGEWLPLEVALAHYQACDAIGLSEDEQIAIGKAVSRPLHETFLGLIVKAARGVGMTPWVLLAKGNMMQHRLCKGGGIRISKLGPKAARIELAGAPQMTIPYVRYGLVGLYTGAVELLASNVTTRIVRSESADPGRLLVLRIDWE